MRSPNSSGGLAARNFSANRVARTDARDPGGELRIQGAVLLNVGSTHSGQALAPTGVLARDCDQQRGPYPNHLVPDAGILGGLDGLLYEGIAFC